MSEASSARAGAKMMLLAFEIRHAEAAVSVSTTGCLGMFLST